MAHYERPSPYNYTLGGIRLWVNELLDASATPPKYRGFVDLGCIEEAPFAQAIDFQEHFCASTGTRVKDRKIVKEISSTITVTIVEADPENLRLFFLGGDITDVAASPGGGSVTTEVMKLTGTERRILKDGVNASSVVVEPYGGGAAFTVTTDYVIEDHFGHKAIRRVATGSIGDGDFVEVDYTHDVLESRSFNPLTQILKTAQVQFIGVSDTGQEMIAQFDNVQINPTGDFSWNSDDWTSFQLELDILDNSLAAPSAPYGVIQQLGAGQNI